MAGLPSSCNGISTSLQNAQYLIFQLDTFEGVRSVAICPNCHRRVHHGEDGKPYNSSLAQIASDLESGN